MESLNQLKNQLKPGEIFLINNRICVYPGIHDDFWTSDWLNKIEIIEAASENQGPLITRLLWKKS
jgi:hypothetical protein